MGMTDERVNVIVYNAFNGMGDSTGDDNFGYSVAWIDLDDYVECDGFIDVPEECRNDSDALASWLKTWRDVAGCRYALAYIDADGSRSAIGYYTREDVLEAYSAHVAAYLAWFDADDTETE